MSPETRRLFFLGSWLITLAWTVLLVYLLMKPGSDSLPVQSFIASFFRLSFSHADLIEAVAHVGMFGSLTLLWWWTLANHYPARCAVSITVVIVALLGAATEFGQFFVARSSLMLDLAANFIGIALSIVCLRLFADKLPQTVLGRRMGIESAE